MPTSRFKVVYHIMHVFFCLACECPPEDPQAIAVKPGDTKIDYEWKVPVPSCLECQSSVTTQSLSVGKHSIAYKYNVADKFNLTCRVNVEVKGKKVPVIALVAL